MENNVNERKDIWENRAKEFGSDWRATLGEKYLRLLEIKTMIKFIKCYDPKLVYDIGSGNGYSTLEFARVFPHTKFIGIDYSEEMIKVAKERETQNCQFEVGDIMKPETLPKEKADLIVTQRCIQNLSTYEEQKMAINTLRKGLNSSGTLLLMECSKNGVALLNKVRKFFFRKPLTQIEPWHNTFLYDENLIEDFSANIFHFCSTYMFIAKVFHPRFAWIGYHLPNIGKIGYDKLYVIKGSPS